MKKIILILILLTACKTTLVEPEETPFNINGTWQAVMDKDVGDGVGQYPFLRSLFNLSGANNGQFHGTGEMDYQGIRLYLKVENGMVSSTTVSFRAVTETWNIKDITFMGNIKKIDNQYWINGHLYFTVGTILQVFVLHMKQQDVGYLPKQHDQGIIQRQ